MVKARTLVDPDVHARKIVAAIFDLESGELRFAGLPGEPAQTVELCRSLPGPERATYEAGPTGYGYESAQASLADYRGAVDAPTLRRSELERLIEAEVPDSPWVTEVGRLRCLRGIDTLSAVGLCAEIGDFRRFGRAGQLMSYLGLVPSEHSSGEQRRLGSITKSGSRHARRLLVEAAWHYRRRPTVGVGLRRRQDGQPAEAVAISWSAQQRLHRVWERMRSRRRP